MLTPGAGDYRDTDQTVEALMHVTSSQERYLHDRSSQSPRVRRGLPCATKVNVYVVVLTASTPMSNESRPKRVHL